MIVIVVKYAYLSIIGLCRAKSASEKNVTHKHILLDKNSSYTIIGGSSSVGAPQNYRKPAEGAQMGVIKGAELDDLTITIATEDDQRLKIKVIFAFFL